MRLIDAEELKNMFRWYEKIRLSTNEICKIIDNEPTAEKAQGIWKYKEYDYYCSNCGNNALQLEDYPCLSAYCPFCGAEMEIEQ